MGNERTETYLKRILNINNLGYFLIICLLSIGVNEYINYFHYSKDLVYRTYAEAISYDRIEQIFKKKERLEWVVFVLTPIFLIVKVFYFACALTVSSTLIINKLDFRANFNILLKSEITFCAMLLARVISINFFINVNSLDDLNYTPFSLLNYLNKQNIPKYYHYGLQLINIWEVLYSFLTIQLIRTYYEVSTAKASQIFLSGYLGSLLLWVIAILFLTIQFS